MLKAGKKYTFRVKTYTKNKNGTVKYKKMKKAKKKELKKLVHITYKNIKGYQRYELYLKTGKSTYKRVKIFKQGGMLCYIK